ncbi:TM9S4 protein, partial [Atractosteus spatula]|nr:TM9S4 protein [Atractosteus spatula]
MTRVFKMAAAMETWLFVLFSILHTTNSFYVPGVAPINFHQNDVVEIKAVKLTSSHTQLPYEYYSLPFCRPDKVVYKAENLGEVLRGDRIVNTPFEVRMTSEKKCEVLCGRPKKALKLSVEESKLMAERIKEEYYVHLIADNLPVATRLEAFAEGEGDEEQKKDTQKDVQFEHGYRLGFTQKGRFFLHNHLSFVLYYHKEKVEEEEEPNFRVVRFEVIPQSVALEDLKTDDKGTCTLPESSGNGFAAQVIDPAKENEVLFTYSVHWEESSVKWASRWDTYLTMSDVQIHWFSIVNSVVVVFFLSGILSMIIIRTLRKDIANYNKEDDIEDTMEESGWKNVHGDVFRPPQYPMILSSLLGSGIQLFCMVLIVIIVAMLGMLSPSSRGALMTTACFLFMFMGVFGGYFAGRLYRTLKGHRWRKGAFCTATLYPAVVFGICFILNCFIWGEHSSGAVRPCGTRSSVFDFLHKYIRQGTKERRPYGPSSPFGILSMIIIRTLRKDIANYNKEDDIEDTMEESGWKNVHGDVFRPPQYPMILSSLLGSGIQLFCMVLIVIIVAMLGMLSPSSRGALMTTACFLFMFMGVFGGYFAGRLYRTLKGHRWRKGAFCTATLYPAVVFGICFILNCFIWGEHSSGAVPFVTMVALLCMWFGISMPLVYLGYYFGFRKQPYDNPVRTNQIPRQIPEQRWYMNKFVGILMAGILPFGAMFIELFFIFSAIWENQFYYLFGFLFLVFIILVVSCSQISIVMVYFQLCAEDYRWWWRTFLVSGGSAFYVLIYAIFYFVNKLDIVEFIPSLLYFGYTTLMVLSFWLLTGTIGFYAAYMFIRKIYAAVKID